MPQCRECFDEAYLVASNVRAGVRLRADEAVVTVVSAPGDDGVVVGGVGHGTGVTRVLLAIDGDAVNTAVGVDGGGEGAQKGGFLHEGGHLDVGEGGFPWEVLRELVSVCL